MRPGLADALSLSLLCSPQVEQPHVNPAWALVQSRFAVPVTPLNTVDTLPLGTEAQIPGS